MSTISRKTGLLLLLVRMQSLGKTCLTPRGVRHHAGVDESRISYSHLT